MPELKAHRPDPAIDRPDAPDPTAVSTYPGGPTELDAACWALRASRWLRQAARGMAQSTGQECSVDRFARLAAAAREPEEVRVELVRLAWKLSGASKVELLGDLDGRACHRLACWPTTLPHETTTEARSALRGPIARAIQDRTAPKTLQLPLKAGDQAIGTLRLTSSDRRLWPARLVARLTTLCAIASSAERGLAHPGRGLGESGLDHGRGSLGATVLAGFLGFAQAQARRRHEPLTLMEIAVDRLDSIRELLGDEIAEAAVERVCRAIKSTVRASDVVTRLEEGRIAVLLPNASTENATKVAGSIRVAIARAGTASTTMPTLTASIGLANYPDHSHDVATLRAAASSTLTRAREQGHDRIAIAPPIPALVAPGLAHHVG